MSLQHQFVAQFTHTVILPSSVLAAHAVAPLSPPILTQMESDWKTNVLEH